MPLTKSRNNPQIWRLAKWISDNFIQTYDPNEVEWILEQQRHEYRDEVYDLAAELLKKINNNDFVGPDNHSN